MDVPQLTSKIESVTHVDKLGYSKKKSNFSYEFEDIPGFLLFKYNQIIPNNDDVIKAICHEIKNIIATFIIAPINDTHLL